MRPGIFLFLVLGFFLRSLSKAFEFRGDMATAPGDRLFYHVLALVILIAAIVCFWKAGRAAWRTLFGPKPEPHAELVQVFAEESEAFDADAALARYNQRMRGEGTAPSPAPRGGFGRKGL